MASIVCNLTPSLRLSMMSIQATTLPLYRNLTTPLLSKQNSLLWSADQRKLNIPQCSSARSFSVTCGVTQLDPADFSHAVLDSKVPVLVNFKSKCCGTCKSLDQKMEWASGIYKERLKFVSVEKDSASQLFKEYEVYKIPTLILFNEGHAIKRKEGYMTKEDLREYLES